MVEVFKPDGQLAFALHHKTHTVLSSIKKRINEEDSEYWVLMYGGTGCGKSLKAQHWGYFIDSSIVGKPERVCFTKKEFTEAVIGGQRGQVIIADEAISMFFNRAAMTKDSRLIMELINQIRQKNLCIILCVPNPLSMDNLIHEKINMIVQVWESKGEGSTTKGNYGMYPKLAGNDMVGKLIRYYKLRRGNPEKKLKFPGPFVSDKGTSVNSKPWYPVGEELYRAKKESVLKKYLEVPELDSKDKKKEEKFKILLFKYVKRMLALGQTIREIAAETGISKSEIGRMAVELKESSEQSEIIRGGVPPPIIPVPST